MNTLWARPEASTKHLDQELEGKKKQTDSALPCAAYILMGKTVSQSQRMRNGGHPEADRPGKLPGGGGKARAPGKSQGLVSAPHILLPETPGPASGRRIPASAAISQTYF